MNKSGFTINPSFIQLFLFETFFILNTALYFFLVHCLPLLFFFLLLSSVKRIKSWSEISISTETTPPYSFHPHIVFYFYLLLTLFIINVLKCVLCDLSDRA